tara:strand:+ start:146 stop:1543 length:1398 start_codon:yes stop_codon:yes gene_type:complete
MKRSLFAGKVKRIHFVGIGGVGMSGIAEVLLNLDFEVHGSDMKKSETVSRLQGLGAQIHIGHREENLDSPDVVVASTAVTHTNVEVALAHQQGVPVIPRAEMLAELMRLKQGIAVAGSHGKTTTTSLVAAILHEAQLDPTVVIGGKVNQLGSNARLGKGQYMVAEADESDGSFTHLSPVLAVVTNLDEEHLDHWTGGLPQLKAGFTEFINRLPFYGSCVLCIDEENVQDLLPDIKRRVVTYGTSRQADFQARAIAQGGLNTLFEVVKGGELLGQVSLALVGQHNVLNALAAIVIADELNVSFEVIQKALDNFSGVDRRFSMRGQVHGITVIDDYGHHPTEIKATLNAAKRAFKGQNIKVIFQPHRYSRTATCLMDFARAFHDADEVWVSPIYAAGEAPIENIDADRLVAEMRKHGHRNVQALSSLENVKDEMLPHVVPGDVVITLGAGTITKTSTDLVSLLEQSK